jgi:HlyD family secretion protein
MKNLVQLARHQPLLLILPAVVLLALLVAGVRWLITDHTVYVAGTIEATHIDVSSKIPARIRRFLVDEGSAVSAGDTLLCFENREIGAKVGQARAAMGAAEARYRMAVTGARKEEVAMARNAFRQAGWSVEGLRKTYDRMKALRAEEVISQQQWDEIDYRYRAAVELRDAAREKYDMVRRGARAEDKEAAHGLYLQAQSAVAEAESYLDETTLRAPIGGVVEKKMVDDGEIAAAGYPLISIIDPARWWVIVNLDERTAGRLTVGQTLSCRVPSKNDALLAMRVVRVSVLSDFATKRATNEQNSFDTRTFEVKMVPADTTVRLHEGSTVLVPVSR